MKFKYTLALSAAVALSLASSACTTTTNTTTANANKSNTAVAANSNAAANKPAAANTAPAAANTNASAAPVSGDTIKIDEAGIAMTIPKGFKFSKDGEDTIVKTEDEGVDIRFTVPKDNDYNKVVMDAAQEIDDYLKDVKIEDKGSKVDVNGMEGTSMNGTAKDEDGETVMWDLTIINAPKKPILVNIYAEKASIEKHSADVEAFLKSVKKQ